ncbi:MAG: amidohydrolase [Thermomicrobiales bacterium]|nr:amidohydrolase [Thermomicrobiales bacterium]
MSGDLLLVNGVIRTMDRGRPTASAVAIRQGRIVAVGDDAEARAALPAGVETIDLGGRTATPGLNDAHAHPMGVGFALLDLDLAPERNAAIPDLLEHVRRAAAERPRGTWIVGRGYDQALLTERRHPTRADLDAVAPDHPVLLLRMCHHIGAANSLALARAGITAATPDPDGGRIDRDPHGEPTGVVREEALTIVQECLPEPSEDDLMAAIAAGGRDFLANGVTSSVEAGIREPKELRAYQRLREADALPIRTYLMMMLDEMLGAMTDLGIRTGFGDDRLRIGPAKLFSDGSIGGQTARLRRPYVGSADNVGLWMMDPAELKAKVRRAHRAGFQVGIHAIGDAAVELVLDAYAEAQTADPRPNPRHRIEHCSIIDDGLLARIAALGVVPIPGTSFLRHFRDVYIENLGEERIAQSYGMRSFERFGIVAAASSDAPVVPTSAVAGLQTMVARHDRFGRPVNPAEAVSLEDALRAYTVNGAYASFEESIKGTLRPGMLGDVTVFETDLFALDPNDLAAVAVDYAIIAGDIAHARV